MDLADDDMWIQALQAKSGEIYWLLVGFIGGAIGGLGWRTGFDLEPQVGGAPSRQVRASTGIAFWLILITALLGAWAMNKLLGWHSSLFFSAAIGIFVYAIFYFLAGHGSTRAKQGKSG